MHAADSLLREREFRRKHTIFPNEPNLQLSGFESGRKKTQRRGLTGKFGVLLWKLPAGTKSYRAIVRIKLKEGEKTRVLFLSPPERRRRSNPLPGHHQSHKYRQPPSIEILVPMPSSSLRRSLFQVRIPYEDPIGCGGGCGIWEQQQQRGPTYTGEYDAHIESMTRKSTVL